jgi:hypothetical protein
MTDVVIFSDTSLQDNEESWNAKQHFADVIFELPTKSAGPAALATEVRKLGLTCQVINLCFYFTQDEIEAVCEKFITEKTCVVGLSTTFWLFGMNENKKEILKKIIRHTKKLKNTKIALGGTMAANLAPRISADVVLEGFSEASFIEYIRGLKNITTPYAYDFNKSTIEYIENDCLDFNESTVLEVARGCIFKCTFCAYPMNGKKKLDYIKEKEILRAELINNYEQYGIDTYTLSDDTFNDSTQKLEHIYDITSSLGFKIKFVSYLRLDLLNAHREQIDLLEKIGLVGAFFGVETFNSKAGKSIGKGLDPDKQKELLYDLKSKHWKDNINVTIGLISGLPFETKQTHLETIDWILNPSLCNVDRIRPAPLGIPNPKIDKYPFKSEFQMNAMKYGFYWPDAEKNTWKNFTHEIKSYDQAMDMSHELYLAARDRDMVYRGNFSLPLVHNIAKYDNMNIDDLIKMPVRQYTEWYMANRHRLMRLYIDSYKNKIFNLDI